MEVWYIVGKRGKMKVRERAVMDGMPTLTLSHTHLSTAYILMYTFTLILSHPHSYLHTLTPPHSHTLTRMMRKPVEKLWKRN